jgi:hypothetical protein
VAERGACADKDEGVPRGRAKKRRAFLVDQSHSFIVGATVRMVAWAFWSEETIFCTIGVII